VKAKLGQNFLYQPHWQRKVADAVHPQAGEVLVEVGGGPGDITALLAEAAGDLTVIEYDPVLADRLAQRFAGRENVQVVHADVLTVDLRALAHAAWERLAARRGEPAPVAAKIRLFGNLPYYITSPILLHLFSSASVLTDAVIMVQREVAERILAQPGHSEFGLLAATTQIYARPRKLFHLPPSAFRPAPKVESTLLALQFVPRAEELGVEAEQFSTFLRAAFARKRKTLANSLQTRYPSATARAAIEAAGLPLDTRAEQLSLERLAAVYRALPETASETSR
jgi:16S rRNA (adenine1518-N6/adenine1519-N6)-dimethyltransferase